MRNEGFELQCLLLAGREGIDKIMDSTYHGGLHCGSPRDPFLHFPLTTMTSWVLRTQGLEDGFQVTPAVNPKTLNPES